MKEGKINFFPEDRVDIDKVSQPTDLESNFLEKDVISAAELESYARTIADKYQELKSQNNQDEAFAFVVEMFNNQHLHNWARDKYVYRANGKVGDFVNISFDFDKETNIAIKSIKDGLMAKLAMIIGEKDYFFIKHAVYDKQNFLAKLHNTSGQSFFYKQFKLSQKKALMSFYTDRDSVRK